MILLPVFPLLCDCVPSPLIVSPGPCYKLFSVFLVISYSVSSFLNLFVVSCVLSVFDDGRYFWNDKKVWFCSETFVLRHFYGFMLKCWCWRKDIGISLFCFHCYYSTSLKFSAVFYWFKQNYFTGFMVDFFQFQHFSAFSTRKCKFNAS